VINRLFKDPLRGMSEDHSRGLERLVRYSLLVLRPLSFQYWLISLFPDQRPSGRARRDLAVDVSVVSQAILVLGLLFLAPATLVAAAEWLVGYLLFCLYLSLTNILLFSNIPSVNAPTTSATRSVLLLGVNLLQVTFTFALFYRADLNLDPTRAIFGSFLVLGTVGLPADPSFIPWYLTPLHILCNVALVAVVLSLFVSHLRLRLSQRHEECE